MTEANERMSISININGKDYSAEVEARLLLVHFIRDIAGLTGTHVGCDTTHCGACTVLMQDEEQRWRAVKSCTIFAVQADGKKLKQLRVWQKMESCTLYRRLSGRIMHCNVATALQG